MDCCGDKYGFVLTQSIDGGEFRHSPHQCGITRVLVGVLGAHDRYMY